MKAKEQGNKRKGLCINKISLTLTAVRQHQQYKRLNIIE